MQVPQTVQPQMQNLLRCARPQPYHEKPCMPLQVMSVDDPVKNTKLAAHVTQLIYEASHCIHRITCHGYTHMAASQAVWSIPHQTRELH